MVSLDSLHLKTFKPNILLLKIQCCNSKWLSAWPWWLVSFYSVAIKWLSQGTNVGRRKSLWRNTANLWWMCSDFQQKTFGWCSQNTILRGERSNLSIFQKNFENLLTFRNLSEKFSAGGVETACYASMGSVRLNKFCLKKYKTFNFFGTLSEILLATFPKFFYTCPREKLGKKRF